MLLVQTLPLRVDGSEVVAVLDGFRAQDEAAQVAAGSRPKSPSAEKAMLSNLLRGLGG